MHRTARKILIACVLALLIASTVAAQPVEVTKPPHVEVFTNAAGTTRGEKIAGQLVRYDDESLTIKNAGELRTLKWIELTTGSAYTARSRVIDRRDARQWLELGRFAWSINAKTQAKAALASATRMDASLKSEADAILAAEPGAMFRPTFRPDSGDTAADTDPQHAPASSPDPNAEIPAGPSGKRIAPDQVVKYQAATPEQHARAIERARKVAADVASELGLTLNEIQTDHFLIFTDWDAREYDFLRGNVEGAYAVVSQQFEIPVKENVFVGKLPIYMIAKHGDFKRFATQVDRFSPPDTVAGYYTGRMNGMGHMVMWKPRVIGNDLAAAEKRWAYVLTHEFTHAFIARYRSNQRIPRWLNEGVAEVIANSKFPRAGAVLQARRMSLMHDIDFSKLFQDDQMPGGEMYPVMMTMVQSMIAYDRQAFLRYFDDLKAGMDPEEALMKHFKVNHDGLIRSWKIYVSRAN